MNLRQPKSPLGGLPVIKRAHSLRLGFPQRRRRWSLSRHLAGQRRPAALRQVEPISLAY